MELVTAHNQLTYSVSEISNALKRVVEDNFGLVRVRGEISGWKVATSGHAYLKLKDANALLDAVSWKGTVSRLKFKPEDGLEVICTGKLTTYPGRSNYQLVVESMEVAGAGALMALLEKRKAMLAAEGLFDPKRKKPLPFMPRTIGVVTSLTGAVIRDILHRLSDRFGCHVIVWPVAVQGEGAAQQIAAAIEGFNKGVPCASCLVPGEESIQSTKHKAQTIFPDLIIVARGGGSLEDLWAFNEEVVVRAAAASAIPLISAVGHETDTTLIDYASDVRAPTPTAAAEMAVPVQAELILGTLDLGKRLFAAMHRSLHQRQERLQGLARGLPNPAALLQHSAQRLDEWAERLPVSLHSLIERRRSGLALMAARLNPARLIQLLQQYQQTIIRVEERSLYALRAAIQMRRSQLEIVSARLNPVRMAQAVIRYEKEGQAFQQRLANAYLRYIALQQNTLNARYALLESMNPLKILERGFVLARDERGSLVTRAADLTPSARLELVFFDGVKKVKETGH